MDDYTLMRDVSATVSLTQAHCKVLEFIETTFDDVIQKLSTQADGNVQITIKRIASLTPLYNNSDLVCGWTVGSRTVTYGWPGRSKIEAWRFACICKILAEIHCAIIKGEIITKRDIYYQDPELFKKQDTVNKYIDDIAHTCGVSRSDLNVTASPKGLICGIRGSGTIEIVPDEKEHIDQNAIKKLSWVLVVEKEASFKSLVEARFTELCSLGPGLLVTGKGYPDLATRKFLRRLIDETSHHLPLFGLFDCDPDGLDILRCYCVGSVSLAQERHYNLPEMCWVGIRPCQVVPEILDVMNVMRAHDRRKAISMLCRPDFHMLYNLTNGSDRLRSALQQMLMLNRKAEIQILDGIGGGLTEWLQKSLDIS